MFFNIKLTNIYEKSDLYSIKTPIVRPNEKDRKNTFPTYRRVLIVFEAQNRNSRLNIRIR